MKDYIDIRGARRRMKYGSRESRIHYPNGEIARAIEEGSKTSSPGDTRAIFEREPESLVIVVTACSKKKWETLRGSRKPGIRLFRNLSISNFIFPRTGISLFARRFSKSFSALASPLKVMGLSI